MQDTVMSARWDIIGGKQYPHILETTGHAHFAYYIKHTDSGG